MNRFALASPISREALLCCVEIATSRSGLSRCAGVCFGRLIQMERRTPRVVVRAMGQDPTMTSV